MVFMPKNCSRIISRSFIPFRIGHTCLQFVSKFKHLGHCIDNGLVDNDDVLREVRNMFIRSNVLIRKFKRCSVYVKTILFKSYCICLYDAALWTHYNVYILNKLKSCYIRCIKSFFGYKRYDSVTAMLSTLGILSFDTILFNVSKTFQSHWNNCSNSLIRHLVTVRC